jgi:hypothetical protein
MIAPSGDVSYRIGQFGMKVVAVKNLLRPFQHPCSSSFYQVQIRRRSLQSFNNDPHPLTTADEQGYNATTAIARLSLPHSPRGGDLSGHLM